MCIRDRFVYFTVQQMPVPSFQCPALPWVCVCLMSARLWLRCPCWSLFLGCSTCLTRDELTVWWYACLTSSLITPYLDLRGLLRRVGTGGKRREGRSPLYFLSQIYAHINWSYISSLWLTLTMRFYNRVETGKVWQVSARSTSNTTYIPVISLISNDAASTN